MTSCRWRGRERLETLLATYTGRIRPGHAEIRHAEVKSHLSETHFAWIGAFDDTSPFYYRIQSPVFLVEFDHPHGILQANRKRGVARRDGKTCKSW